MQMSEDFLRAMIDKIPILAWSCWPDGTTEFLNQRWLAYTGLAMEAALGWGWQAAIHPEDLAKLMETWQRLLRTGEPGEEEARLRRFDGEYRWFLFRAVPVRDDQGKLIRWYGTNTDIEDLKQVEALLSAEKRVLEMIAGGAALGEILDQLCRSIEAQAAETIGTVLLMGVDGKRLWAAAGPRVPSGWTEAITPLQIGPCVGSCGTAAWLKQVVVVSDIARDPLFDLGGGKYREIALRYGLRASWSQPIVSKNQEVLGTFSMYFAEPRSPDDDDLELIKRAGHIALITIERKRAEEELRRSEAYLAEAQRLSLTGSFGWNVSSGELFWSKETFCILGYDPATRPTLKLVIQRVHPEDRAFVQQIFDQASRDGSGVAFEHRLLFPDGSIKHVRVLAHAVGFSSDNYEFVGAVSDITASKLAEQKIHQDEREFREIVEAIPQLVTVLAPSGETLYVNKPVLEFTGLSLQEIQAGALSDKAVHADDLEKHRADIRRALSRGEAFESEYRMRRRDGQYRWFLNRFNPFLDENGQVLRWYVTGLDIEDRKQAEDRVQKENLALREEIDHSSMFEEIVGSSEALRNVLAQVAKVAPVDSTVLILGETGTGKELIARAIHKRSQRAGRAFIRVNCAAIPASLIASELFGHEKGAFTGALQRRLGRFELADGGTIFLDEVGELPAETQIALLRVLQEREIERVGGSQAIAVDVRVLAATNRDLTAAVAAGAFRQDLFYRLNVFPIEIPSLRERVDDIPLLVEYFIERYGKIAGRKFKNIHKRTLQIFQTYAWPGNIRELQNVIERAVILCEGDTFSVDETWLKPEAPRRSGPTVPFVGNLMSREKELIENALAASRGKIAGPVGAAAKLGIPRQTLESKIKRLGIDRHQFRTRSI